MLLELQRELFEKKLTRRELLAYMPKREPTYRIQVFRNHSFELVEHTIGIYLDYAGFGARFAYSGYDDSLSFSELDPCADLILLWIDAARYSADAVAFLRERLEELRTRYDGPVMMIPMGTTLTCELPGVTVWSLDNLARKLGVEFTDERAESVTGTRLSAKAMLAVARELGLRYLPALLRPAIKALVVDLDNTLYAGVLGEDGVDGIVLTDEHRTLQKRLRSLADAGFFLCVASKNDLRDVETMLNVRTDFPLRAQDFSAIRASWDSKADMVAELARYLNINPDSMVFLDDNIGELTTVQSAFPGIRVICAADAGQTVRVLEEFPGLLKLKSTEEDGKRKRDAQAKKERELIRQSLSPEEYIRSLQLCLAFECDAPARADRVFELANKTNQFIFNYKRYTRQEVEERFRSPDFAVVTVSLRDRLSDSGLIGVCVAHAEEDCAEIEECFVSCRALGRGIDEMIVLGAIRFATRRLGKDRVRICFREGARNAPAQQFVQKWLADCEKTAKPFTYEIPKGLIRVEYAE